MNDEVKRMWREGIMIQSEVIYRHLTGVTEKEHKNPQSG
jgi:hypothetical protein